MPTDSTAWLILVFSCCLTFIVARGLGARWREKRREREREAARAGESRQARRARERRERAQQK